MIIIEQDGTYFVNFKNIEQITMAVDREETEYAIIAETLNDDEVVLGTYATEKRAKEVLQEIIKHYNLLKKESVYAMGDGGFIFEEKFYYEMPEE